MGHFSMHRRPEATGTDRIDELLGVNRSSRLILQSRHGARTALATEAGEDETDALGASDKADEAHAALTQFRAGGDTACLDRAIRLLTAARAQLGDDENDDEQEPFGGDSEERRERFATRRQGEHIDEARQTMKRDASGALLVSHVSGR